LWSMVIIRDVIVAWQHPFFTAFTGIGLAVARINRNMIIKVLAAPFGYGLAVFAHAFHNSFGAWIGGFPGLALGSLIDWSGWIIMFIFIVMMITREHNILKRQLSEEVAAGIITDGQYRRALSPLTASIALFLGGFTASRFYQACGELALKKDQLQKMGDEGGNQRIIDSLRDELANLSPGVKA